MSFVVVIPARYASTRLPGKPLADIAGQPMIAHVARRAIEKADVVVLVVDASQGATDQDAAIAGEA